MDIVDASMVIEDFLPVIRPLAGSGRRGIAVGGSRGKGRNDEHSDFDFRLYTDGPVSPAVRPLPEWADFAAVMAKWEARGVRIDGVWVRGIDEIGARLTEWTSGTGVADDYVWTVWGYHLPTDIAHQTILEDPDGILAGWKQRLAPYPAPLRQALLDRHLAFLRYWRTDYHYRSKVRRGDLVFLCALSAKLVHAMFQVLFALNETYYPGDGWNLPMARCFQVVPKDFEPRVAAALYPENGPGMFERQYEAISALIDDIERLAGGLAASG